eukprot:m.12968 g.12968  ORF g.12968 m.12968 type:complete len:2147 (+) comp24414_c0_seq2:49-6489(+)
METTAEDASEADADLPPDSPPRETPEDLAESPKQLDIPTQARLEALLEAAGVVSSSEEARRALSDPEILRRLTSSVSSALDEAAAALARIRAENEQKQRTTPISLSPRRNSLADVYATGDVSALSRFLTDGKGLQDLTADESESLLSLACSAGYFELAQVLLAMRPGGEGLKCDSSALMEAASGGYVDIVKLLKDHGADVNAQSEAGNTALTYAACGGFEDVIEVLLDSGAKIEEQNESGHTALMEAASAGHVTAAKLLIDRGADVNAHSNEFKETALTLAAYKGHADMVKFLLENGADKEHKTDEMHNALMEACMDGHVDVAEILLNHGAQINMPVDGFEAPLTLAACGGHGDLAKVLIECGANLEELNDEGYTPLMEAAREGNDVVCLLVNSGANVNAITEETQETPLSLCCCGGLVEVATFLLDHGADIELGASTPIMEAAQEGHYDLVKMLLERGAKADAVANNGDTALIFCCSNGHTEVAELLLDAGANLEHKAEGGRTPLMKAARAGHLQTVQFLISRGAGVNMKTSNNDHTVLSLACAGGHLPIVELLLAHGADASHILKDSSTMLIEASKGGHSQVASLLLGQGAHALAPSSPLPSPSSTLTTDWDEMADESSLISRPVGSGNIKGTKKLKKALPPAEKKTPPPAMTTTLPVIETFPSLQSIPSPTTLYPFGDVATAVSGFPDGRHYIPPPPSRPPPHLSTEEDERISPEGQEKPSGSATATATKHPALASLKKLQDSNQALDHLASLTGRLVATAEEAGTEEGFSFTPEVLSLFNAARAGESVGVGLPDPMFSGLASRTAGTDVLKSLALLELAREGSMLSADEEEENPLSSFQDEADLSLGGEDLRKTLEEAEAEFTAAVEQHHQQDHHHHQQQSVPPPSPTSLMPSSHPQFHSCSHRHHHHHHHHHRSRFPDAVGDPPWSLPHAAAAAAAATANGPDIDMQTESNHDTALTLACAGGHDDLVELLLRKGADLEHRDKKGYTPLILSATAGHSSTVDILLQHGAVIETQSDRTKDTALSLACSGGRLEVVEILLAHSADFEHRNVSDYTPLSLAASGGFVSTIKTLLAHGAEINSRTGSKLGISPLMLAAMNGHTAAVKLLLDRGSDINAQIETNRNTALTLACFQGRHEVVQLLIDRRANIEHRAKTGLTPLMEAASGGYVEVGKILLNNGADVNASPVPSSKDTALTIAADKGHVRFVELLLTRKAHVDARNKKGASSLWLACNGGHWEVVQALVKTGAEPDAEDNRKVSCLMAAFRKSHGKVIKYMVKVVSQFPNDSDLSRFISTMSDTEILKKSDQCRDIIVSARDRQAAEANRHANSLLRELALERTKEENRKAAASRRRDKRKRQKQRRVLEKDEREKAKMTQRTAPDGSESESPLAGITATASYAVTEPEETTPEVEKTQQVARVAQRPSVSAKTPSESGKKANLRKEKRLPSGSGGETSTPALATSPPSSNEATTSPRKGGRRSEEGWKEVVRKSKRMAIPAAVVTRIVGRGGLNLTAIRESTGAHIDLDRCKSSQERILTIKGSTDAVRIASNAISSLMKEPDRDVYSFLPKQTESLSRRSRESASSASVAVPAPSSSVVFSATLPSRQQAKSQSSGQQKSQSKPTAPKATTTTTAAPPPAASAPKQKSQSVSSLRSTKPTATTQTAHKPVAPPVKRQLFSTAAAASPKTGQQQQRAVPVSVSSSRPPIVARQGRSISTPGNQPSVPAAVAAPLPPQTAWAPTRNVWTTKMTAMTSVTESKPIVSMAMTTATSSVPSFTPLSHFEPLISASGSSSKAPSPLASPSAASPVGVSPSSSQSKSPAPAVRKTIAPIGGERSQESPSPSAVATALEERPPSAAISTDRTAQEPVTSGPSKTMSTVVSSIKPIGTERAAQRRSENVPTAIVNPGLAAGRPAHNFNPPPETWGIPTFRSDDPTEWCLTGVQVPSQMTSSSLPPPPPPSASAHSIQPRMPYYGGLNSLATLLDKLSLTKHLDLFQQNEIDLDALMLMSEKDYAEIGLPKGPRIKLLNATRRRVDESSGTEPFTSPLPSPSPATSAASGFVPYASAAESMGGVTVPAQVPGPIGGRSGRRWASAGPSGGPGPAPGSASQGVSGNVPRPNQALSPQRQRTPGSGQKSEWKGWNQAV